MAKLKKRVQLDEASVKATLAFLDAMKDIANGNASKFWESMKTNRTPEVIGSYRYWRNVSSGLAWAQAVAVQSLGPQYSGAKE